MAIEGAKVLVTGGAGLVGSHVVDELVRAGAREVVVYDSLVRGHPHHLEWATANGHVRLVEGDLRETERLVAAVEGCEYVCHQAAAWLRQCQREPRISIDVNIVGTFNLLEACVAHGVRKLVAASSSSVYGEGVYLPTDESHPLRNDLFYGASKVANEQYYLAFHKAFDLDYVAFRYLNVYGPRQPFEGAYTDVIMNFLDRIDADESPRVRGDGSATVDLVYAGDVARANVMAFESDVSGEVFNVCSGVETTVRELAETLIRLRGKEGALELAYEPMDSGLVQRRWGDPKKAEALLGFRATTSLEEGLSRVIEWREKTRAQRRAGA